MNSILECVKDDLIEIDELIGLNNSFDIVINDLIEFFFFLSQKDRKIKDDEIKYINENIDTEFDDAKDFIKYAKDNNLNNKIKNPKIVGLLVDNIYKSRNVSNLIIDFLNQLVMVYKYFGVDFLSCDTKASFNEVKAFTKYINELEKNINSIIDKCKKMYASGYLDDDEDYDFKEELDEEETIDDLLDELNSLVGLSSVKLEIETTINLLKVRKIREDRGFTNIPLSNHMIFVGNPGTGKTTVARLLAKIYKKLGILSSGHLVETDRSGLVAGFIGQTAIKTKEVIDSAKGGILFIDEAYSLTRANNGNDYGIEAIDTLIKCMEDYRDDLIVIVAGYPEPMCDFVLSNPGLKSRFPKTIEFEDYTSIELYKIFESIALKNSFKLSDSAKDKLINLFNSMNEDDISLFGNARGVRNLFEASIVKQATRIAAINEISDDELITIIDKDI